MTFCLWSYFQIQFVSLQLRIFTLAEKSVFRARKIIFGQNKKNFLGWCNRKISNVFVVERLWNYDMECRSRRPSMLKTKSWSAARIIFTESSKKERDSRQLLSHVEPKKTTQFSLHKDNLTVSHHGHIGIWTSAAIICNRYNSPIPRRNNFHRMFHIFKIFLNNSLSYIFYFCLSRIFF